MDLYEIDSRILSLIDEDTGEILDLEQLHLLEMERDQKIENIGCWIKNLLSDADALKKEIESMTERKKKAENKATQLKEYLQSYLNGEKYKSAKVAISYRKTASVNVTDQAAIPKDYIRTKVTEEADKTAIKEAIKKGITIPGAEIVEKMSMSIK